jgi:hypothetical protein
MFRSSGMARDVLCLELTKGVMTMKKLTKQRLVLDTSVVRVLTPAQLDGVGGGFPPKSANLGPNCFPSSESLGKTQCTSC